MLAFKSLKPLANRVVIKKVVAETKTKSGIILTSAQKGNELNQGTIIEVGPGRLPENGQIKPIDVKVGDVVLLPEYGGSKVTLADDNELFIYRDDDIMGTLHDPSE